MSKLALAFVDPARSQGWKPIHHINQIQPKGADQSYVNGAYNCAPAAVAMLARGHGKFGDLTDAQLVQQLGKDIVTKDGTDANGVGQMLERAGIPPAGEALGAGYSDADVKNHLAQGHKLMAQVRTLDPKTNEASAHYVVVQGTTPRGNYIVSDPLAKEPYVVSPQQLKEAVLKCPPDGGMLIPVSTPAEAKAAEAQKAAQEAAGPGANPALPPELGGADTFAGPNAPPAAGGGTPRSILPVAPPAIGRGDTFVGPVAPPAAGGGAPRPIMGPIAPPAADGGNTFVGPVAPPAAGGGATPVQTLPEETVNKDAFTATDDALKGSDTKFHQDGGGGKVDDRFKNNQHRNHYHVGVDYSHGHRRAKRDGKEASVTPARESARSFANEILELKKAGSQKAYDLLAMLEDSQFDKDRQVLALVQQADLRDPGIGKRYEGDGF